MAPIEGKNLHKERGEKRKLTVPREAIGIRMKYSHTSHVGNKNPTTDQPRPPPLHSTPIAKLGILFIII